MQVVELHVAVEPGLQRLDRAVADEWRQARRQTQEKGGGDEEGRRGDDETPGAGAPAWELHYG
jgi:hypothetical protein